MTDPQKYLIVNADDFGQSDGVNRGIIESYERGIVTSTSLMVRWPGSGEAAEYARLHPEFSVGLHVDLGEWRSVDGEWQALYEVVPLDDLQSVRAEVHRQLNTFRELVGKDPSHIDSHQHVHLREQAVPAVRELAADLGVPLRHATPGIAYCGEFYGQSATGQSIPEAVSVEGLVKLLTGLSEGATELACHPGLDVVLNTMYCAEREWEVQTLTDNRVRRALDRSNIRLVSFHQIDEHLAAGNRIP